MAYDTTASEKDVLMTIDGLKKNNIEAQFIKSREELTEKIAELIPEGSEVMTMTSVTLDTLGIAKNINESGKYNSVRMKLNSKETPAREKKRLGAAPEITIGSVHAVTHTGDVIIASNTGSQLPAYAYGADKVVWVVGTQKIVKDMNEAMKRVYDYVLPLEADRARKAYGTTGSNVSKVLAIHKEVTPNRIHLLFINEALGF